MPVRLLNDGDLHLSIDRLRLDEEWLTHSEMVYAAAKKAADAQFSLDQAKAAFERECAELAKDMREDGPKYGLKDNPSEKSIDSAMPLEPGYKAGQRALNEAKHQLALANSLVNSFEHRKRALSLYTELHLKQWRADPAPVGRGEEGREYEKHEVRTRGLRRPQDESRAEDKTEDWGS